MNCDFDTEVCRTGGGANSGVSSAATSPHEARQAAPNTDVFLVTYDSGRCCVRGPSGDVGCDV